MAEGKMRMYDFDQSVISSLAPVKNLDKLKNMVNKFYKETENKYYALHGHAALTGSSYLTILKMVDGKAEFTSLGESIVTLFAEGIGPIVHFKELPGAIEIWYKSQSDDTAYALYLFPYDEGIVEVSK